MSQTLALTTLSFTAGGICSCAPPAEAPSTQRTADGSVRFENANYRITVGDNNEVLIHNKNTGESYRVWGDPHVEIDGEHAFDFWGQTTFVLDDGTKVTIGTTPWEGSDNGATVASEVTITDGDYTVEINGVDTNTKGDLGFREYHEVAAKLAELAERDGNTVYENENGKGFFVVDGNGNIRNVDQAFIDATDEVKQRGQDFLQAYAEMLQLFSGLLSIVFAGSLDSGGDDAPRTDVVHQSGDESIAWSWSFSLALTRVSAIT